MTVDISIHRSLAGPDGRGCVCFRKAVRISIHRSLAGPDRILVSTIRKSLDFNPQVPCGTRLDHQNLSSATSEFQSTGPLRDPTTYRQDGEKEDKISIHRSLAGPDKKSCGTFISHTISIHRSLAGPDLHPSQLHLSMTISIHRSLAGPDICN